MAGTSSISGLISGLDTTTLVTQLMQIESAPQTLLKTKQTKTTNVVSALQSLNSKVASLADAAKSAAAATSWQALTARSSASSVTASATAGGAPTSISFTVDRTAAAQVSLVPASSSGGALLGSSGSLTLVSSAGTIVSVPTAGATSAQDVARAISSSDAGVGAVAVKLSDGSYRLQLSAKQSGAANGFALYDGAVTQSDLDAGTATPTALTQVQGARDAQVTLWSGVAGAEAQFTSSSNTFADLVPGLSITVSQAESTPVTVSTSRDDAALAKLGSNLVGQLNLVLGEITSRTTSTTTTAADGGTVLTPGVLGGESDVRMLQGAVSDAASYAVTYQGQLVSPSSVGVVIGSDGTFTFDADAFAASMAADPDKTQAVLTAVAQRVSDAATTYSDPYEGLLTSNIAQQQSAVKQLGDQITDWDTRLATRKSALERQYSNLEVTLSQLQSQSSWLASQLGTLPSASSGSSSKS